jgi:LysR family hydrogen peroxide-inducible transcriptional activator
LPTITQLEYLLALDREQHFGQAARACHVSQPSLSTQLQKLEEELGVILFDRSKKPILATETGRQVIEQAKVTLKEMRKIQSIASSGSAEPRGPFHLGVIPTLAPYVLPLFVGPFARLFPKVELKIGEFKTEDLLKGLITDELDGGLLVTPLGNDQLIERHLFFEPFYIYVSEGHPMAKKKFFREGDLPVEDLWLLEEGHCFRDQVLRVCSMDYRASVLKNIDYAGGNVETLKNLVNRGQGYTLLPELAVEGLQLGERERQVRRFRKPVPTREVSLVHSRSFLKESILSALEMSILQHLPRRIRSLKRQDVSIIDV